MTFRKLFLVIIVLTLAALACGPGDFIPTESSETEIVTEAVNVVATSVALTLAAESPGSPPTEPPAAPPTEPPVVPVTEAPPPPPPAVLRIVYVNDGDVWLWTEGIGGVELYDGPDPVESVRISPDGQVIAFTVPASPFGLIAGVWAINNDGSNLRLLIDGAALNALSSEPSALGAVFNRWTFIPGTHTIAFNTRLIFEGPGLIIQGDLRLIDTDTLVFSTLLPVGGGGEFYYSPDGSQVAITTPTSISLMNADGSNWRDSVLVYTFVITYSEYEYYAIPRWSADSTQLRAAIPSADPFAPGASVTVWDIHLDATPATSLGTYTSDMAIFNSGVIISPDLSQVAYLERTAVPTDNTWMLHIADLGGPGDIIYHTGNLNFSAWSPDSIHFAFKEALVLRLGQFGAGFADLADTPAARNMVWVDGDTFLYNEGSSGAWQLRLKDIGAASILIVAPVADFLAYDFSN
ncbi:MAG: hypothetical protein FVQ83_11230 [Chloroflexi bacterium]|nr:hypothetical protein [Chloroflexota bacterium]